MGQKVKLKAPPGSSGACSFGGEEFAISKKGFVTVPVEAVTSLKDHGFVSTEEPDEQEVPPAPPAA